MNKRAKAKLERGASKAGTGTLFAAAPEEASETARAFERAPLAEQLRPATWALFEGGEALDSALMAQLRRGEGRPPSLVLWGPPGCGKTTFAKLIGHSFSARFVEFSAVLGGVKEVRDIIAEAEAHPQATILFVDEIHRFNKSQQDAFLPHVERGTIVLIGATTENPSFALTGALMSRCKVVVMPPLAPGALAAILVRGAERLGVSLSAEASSLLCEIAGGDARKGLNLLEGFANSRHALGREIDREEIREFLVSSKSAVYDRSGEEHYNQVSAFIKSMRGSDPDAALFWGFRMLESGEDPRFVIRRMIIFASEDVGNADPRALQLAIATSDAFERLGMPEGRIPIAQCITYLASAPKSNRSYLAMHRAIAASEQHVRVTVPLHLRNAPTGLMKSLSYGEEYQYPHDQHGAFARGVSYLPEEVGQGGFYEPSDRGYEKMIGERLALLRSQARGAATQGKAEGVRSSDSLTRGQGQPPKASAEDARTEQD